MAVSKETRMSIEASSIFPGFRFCPTDVELISYYLKKKMEGSEKCVEIIPLIDICRYEPWDLPAKSVIQSENEWFYFSARGRKYPNGSQSRRATELGYWKATGKERNVKSGNNVIGTKRTLVFHIGRAPKGERTEWIMHEYCMIGKSQDSLVVCRLRKNIDFRHNEALDRGAQNQSNLPTANNSSSDAIEGDIDRMLDVSEWDKAAECSKKCSSSHDSHSIEQLDSASESEQKLSLEFNPAESSSHQKDSDNDDDFFADILNDDIVKLDEISLFATPELLPMVATKSQAETIPQLPTELMVSQAIPSLTTDPNQGTANRRLKLKWPTPGMSLTEAFQSSIEEYLEEETKPPQNQERPPECVLDLISMKMGHKRAISLFCVVLSLVVLWLSWLGGSQQIKRILYGCLYKVKQI